jgi:hypothetical protein|nr:MAG TPA: hypothetical protein [Microviridae sp.]
MKQKNTAYFVEYDTTEIKLDSNSYQFTKKTTGNLYKTYNIKGTEPLKKVLEEIKNEINRYNKENQNLFLEYKTLTLYINQTFFKKNEVKEDENNRKL